MPHFFISYAREDKTIAEAVANLLTSEGFEVWWDPEIRVGEHFPNEIERAIFRSDYVLVLWSKHAVESEWVRREARTGQNFSRLVPIQLDDCELPRGFRSIHTHRFEGYPELLQELYRTVGGGGFALPSGARHMSVVASQSSVTSRPATVGMPPKREWPFYTRYWLAIVLVIALSIGSAGFAYWIHLARYPAPDPPVLAPPPPLPPTDPPTPPSR